MRAAFTALSAGDMETLIALSDVKAIYEAAMTCESTEMETKVVEQRLRNEYRNPIAKSKGTKVEVVEVTNLERDNEKSLVKNSRKNGCTARLDVDFHSAKVKFKVGDKAEVTTARVGLVELGGRWYVSRVPSQLGSVYGDALAKFTALTERMCKCKDAACAAQVQEDYMVWAMEISKGMDDNERPDEDTMKQFSEIATKYSECHAKVALTERTFDP